MTKKSCFRNFLRDSFRIKTSLLHMFVCFSPPRVVTIGIFYLFIKEVEFVIMKKYDLLLNTVHTSLKHIIKWCENLWMIIILTSKSFGL